MNSWLLSHRRVNERKVENYVGFVHLACIRILLRHYFWDEFYCHAERSEASEIPPNQNTAKPPNLLPQCPQRFSPARV
jgi:hypothetical protein